MINKIKRLRNFIVRALRFAVRKPYGIFIGSFVLRSLGDFVIRFTRFILGKPPGIYFGRFLLRLLPASYKSRLYEGFYTGSADTFGAMLYPAMDLQYYSMSEKERERINRENIWGSQGGKNWHDVMNQSVQGDKEQFTGTESFLKYRRPLIRQILELLSANQSYNTICEIGTGNGMFLDYLSGEFPTIKKFVGIDLNQQQITDNKKTYKNSGLEFVHTEITDWVRTENKNGIIFVTVCVLEYFSQKALEELLDLIRKNISPVAIAISEPTNINLDSQVISKPRGRAAYSYNYPHLFKQHGYKIFRQELQHVDPNIPFYDTVIMLATA